MQFLSFALTPLHDLLRVKLLRTFFQRSSKLIRVGFFHVAFPASEYVSSSVERKKNKQPPSRFPVFLAEALSLHYFSSELL